MARRHYLVSYDISDDKRRARVFHTLRDHGDHVQYSVFLCELDAREVESLRGELAGLIHNRQDQILLLDLGPATTDLTSMLQCLGRAYQPDTPVIVV